VTAVAGWSKDDFAPRSLFDSSPSLRVVVFDVMSSESR